MLEPVADHYDSYYAAKLWSLIPAVYRAEDGDAGALRELVARFGSHAAILRRSIDRLWEDQSIESCDDWVISYIGELLATNLVSSLDARGQRIDVAKTIYYRRRKGTVPLLEELSANITGWDARVVEFFRRLGRTRHGLDPAFGWPLEVVDASGAPTLVSVEGLIGPRTRTPLGGFADLRNVWGALSTGTAFDETSHTADVRVGRGATGWYNIPHLGVFLWRLQSVPLIGVTPVQYKDCHERFTFDPTGREIPLFAASNRSYGDSWISPREQDLPAPISRALLASALDDLYGWDLALALTIGDAVVEDTVPVTAITADPRKWGPAYFIDPALGRLYLANGSDAANLLVSYHYGFPSTIGAGGYDRRVAGQVMAVAAPTQEILGGGTALGSIPTSGTIVIGDSRTYTSVPTTVTIAPGALLVVGAQNRQRPLFRLTPRSTWTFIGQADADGHGSELVLDGIFTSGCDVVLDGVFERVTLRCCTIDPGSSLNGTKIESAADGVELVPGHLVIAGSIRNLVVERSVLGPIQMGSHVANTEVEAVSISDSLIQSVLVAESAVSLRTGTTNLERTTILGTSTFHRIEASNSIFDGVAKVDDAQQGCTRFCAFPTASRLPRAYECVEMPFVRELFVSRAFGNPAFAQLTQAVEAAISQGIAANGTQSKSAVCS
jgi:hypothetical protein